MSDASDVRSLREIAMRCPEASADPWDDAHKLAAAFLAANPADDDKPVTEAWALANGGERQGGSHPYYILFIANGSSPCVVWDTRSDHWSIGGGGRLWNDETPTRRAVRDLCRALSIPLQEPTP